MEWRLSNLVTYTKCQKGPQQPAFRRPLIGRTKGKGWLLPFVQVTCARKSVIDNGCEGGRRPSQPAGGWRVLLAFLFASSWGDCELT